MLTPVAPSPLPEQPAAPEAIDEWVALFANREEMAWEYARWILNEFTDDWRQINDAIIRRWSQSGLLYIKRLAWRYAREEAEELHV